MGYCFVSTQKIKSLGQLMSKYNHNHRIANVENADPSLRHLNTELIPCQSFETGDRLNYVEAWKERINSLDYYQNHRVRSNAVLATEVIMTFSREESINLKEWKDKNVEWLKKTFDVAGDGRSNIIDATYHADEPGNVHIHAIVIPIDERGHLNAARFTNGSKIMSQMQTNYANAMKEFGLKRGLEGSSARHQDIRKFYTDLNQSIKDIPEPKQEESASQYKERVIEELQTAKAALLREAKKIERLTNENTTKHFLELKSSYSALLEVKNDLDKLIDEETHNLGIIKKKQEELLKKITISEKEIEELRALKIMSENEYKEILVNNYICDKIKKSDPTMYADLKNSIIHMVEDKTREFEKNDLEKDDIDPQQN